VSSAETGVGLRGMRERLRQLGGTLQIQSNGHGTRVTAILPVVGSESVPVVRPTTLPAVQEVGRVSL
jgi:signal transduction histidine kinase